MSGYCHSWPRIFLFKYVFSTWLGMCSRRRWSTLFVAFFCFFVLCSHHANVACTIPQKNSTLNDPLQRPSPPLSQPTLSSLWPELRHVIISTGAGTKNNYCTNLLDTSSPYTPSTSSPLRILLLCPSLPAASAAPPPCAVFCQLKLPNCHLVASLLAFFICWF